MGTLEASDGTPLVFSDNGAGPPVLLLHGLACTRQIWTDVTRLLASTRRVIAVDLRGHGESVPAADFSVDQQADDVRAVLVDLDLRGVVVVGHSAGGYAALAFAERFPDVATDRVARIVTLGTSPSLNGWREKLVLRFSVSRAFYGLFAIAPIGRLVVRTGAFGHKPNDAAVEATRRMALNCGRSTKTAWVHAISGKSVLLPTGTRVVLATGERDTTVTPERLRALAAGTDAVTSVLAGAGHMSPLEVPMDVVELITTD